MHDDKKIVLLGHPRVGKTALVLQLVESRFASSYDPTIEDQFESTLEVGAEKCDLRICDTAGDEKYEELRNKQIRDAHGFLLCFSITDRASFYSVRRYYKDVIRARSARHWQAVGRTQSPSAVGGAQNGGGASPNGDDYEELGASHARAALSASNLRLSRLSEPPMFDEFAGAQQLLQMAAVLVGLKGDLWAQRQVEEEEIESLAREVGLPYLEVSATSHADAVRVFTEVVKQCRKYNEPECTCGAAEARAKKQAHEPCHCQQVCAQCQRRRFVHSSATHAFVTETTAEPKSTSCCSVM